jgi:hypothetical protein
MSHVLRFIMILLLYNMILLNINIILLGALLRFMLKMLQKERQLCA